MFTAKTALKTIVAPLAVLTALAAASPAFAQTSNVQFGFQFGNGPQHNGGGYGSRCLSNREVIRGIDGSGYDRVRINRELPRQRVDVTAERGNWVYALRVNKCTGETSQPERVRPISRGNGFPNHGRPGDGYPGNGYPGYGNQNGPRGGYDGYDGNGGFNFQFGIGN